MALREPASQAHSLMQPLHVLIERLDLGRLDYVNVEIALDVKVPRDILTVWSDCLLDHFLRIKAVFLAVLLV